MQFTKFHEDYFSATSGSFSRVTEREFFDSQITLTDYEAASVIEYFALENIHVGNVQTNKIKASKTFLLYPEFNEVNLNLVFPKPDKPELRLYLSNRSGFKPNGGMIWFLYVNTNNRLVIGFMNEQEWNKIGQIDLDDEVYQNNIENLIIKKAPIQVPPEGRISTTEIGAKTVYRRDPRMAVIRFETVDYHCEIHPDHKTFTSLATNRPYVEAHHFIPMKFQHLFEQPLDSLSNVVALCPNCHRAIHHATIDYKLHLIDDLYNKRPEMHNFSFNDIAQFYNCLTL